MAGKLTAQRCGSDTYAMGISLDQYIAQALNEPGTPALTLLVGNKANNVLGHISYTGAGQPVTGENNPALAYQDLVGLGNLDDEALQRLLARRQSVLDLVSDEYVPDRGDAVWLARQGWRVTASDISERALAYARKSLHRYKWPNLARKVARLSRQQGYLRCIRFDN